MARFKPNRYSIDNGQYQRFLNEEGKAEGIRKVAVEVGRNSPCPCKSGLKYKKCCLPKGRFYVESQKKTKLKGLKKATLKIRLKRLFKKR